MRLDRMDNELKELQGRVAKLERAVSDLAELVRDKDTADGRALPSVIRLLHELKAETLP